MLNILVVLHLSFHYQIFASALSEKSPCISVEQVNILDVTAVKRHNSWSCYLYLILFLPIISPCLWFGQLTNKHRSESDVVIFKYNSRNNHRMKDCSVFLWKTIWLLFEILRIRKSSVWNGVSLCCTSTLNCLVKQIHSK
jgi:hypothetical protein